MAGGDPVSRVAHDAQPAARAVAASVMQRTHGARAYYNEIEPFAAQWLRNLIAAGHIAPGDVDTRSIADVGPDDLRGYTQCHFFAGIGGWSAAVRMAGWRDDREIWSGSCPCQPFSAAGKQRGEADERHLWPEFARLIRECRPSVVAGEQVASALGRTWLVAVRADLEAMGYAVGAADLCAAGVGAPHIRQRLWWVADANGGHAGAEREQRGREQRQQPQDGGAGVLADALHAGRAEGWAGAGRGQAAGCGGSHRMADSIGPRLEGRDARPLGDERATAERGGAAGFVGNADSAGPQPRGGATQADRQRRAAVADGWHDLAWLPCRDGKARPTQSGLQPLAHGISDRVGRLRAYGNAIVPALAAEVIAAFMECAP
jgi:DNA (cytosine-5)-methyltransferase 1